MCCISIILISLVSVNYFFYLKKEHKENDFPNIISTSVSYIDNKLIITYDIDEKELFIIKYIVIMMWIMINIVHLRMNG